MKRRSGGRFVEYERRGTKVIRAWPRKQTKDQNAKRLAACQLFVERVKAIKQEPARTQIAARDMAKGSALLPRDVQMMLMATSLYGVIEIDGERYYPVPVQREVSDALDVIARDHGALLYRSPDGWVGLAPGNPGQFLTRGANPEDLQWQTPPQSAGLSLIPRFTPTLKSVNNSATKGTAWLTATGVTVRSLIAMVGPSSDSTYELHLVRWADGVIAEVLASSPPIQVLAGVSLAIRHRLATPVTLTPGSWHAVMCADITSTDTRACAIYQNPGPADGFPVDNTLPRWVRMAKRLVAAGDTLEWGSTAQDPYCAGPEG